MLGRSVFFFHNGSHLAVGLADDAAQPEGVGRDVGEQADFAAGGLQQLFQGGAVNQRHVAVEHEGAAGVAKVRQGGLYGVAGAELFGLLHPADAFALHLLAHLLFAVADDYVDTLRAEALRGIDNALEHGLSADTVQHFGQGGIHAGAFAGGEDDDMEGLVHEGAFWNDFFEMMVFR